MDATAPAPANFQSLAAAAPQAPTFSLNDLLAQKDPAAASPFANEAFLQSQAASRGHIVQQVQNAANEVARQNQFALEQLGQLPSRFEGIYGAADKSFQQNAGALQQASQAMGVGQQSADSQMAPILAALAQQKAGNLSNVPLLEAGTRELGMRQQGQLAMQGQELLNQLDQQSAQYVGQREGEERQHQWQLDAESRQKDWEKEKMSLEEQHQQKMADIDHQYRMGELSAQQAFQQKEAEKQRAFQAQQAADDRKAEAEKAAVEQRNRVQENLDTYRGQKEIDKQYGINDFAPDKTTALQRKTLDTILQSFGGNDGSIDRGAAILQDPSRKDLDVVLADKDYQNAVSKVGKQRDDRLFGIGPHTSFLRPKYDVEDLAKDLEKKGKYRSAAVLRAQYGDKAADARMSLLQLMGIGG